MRNKMMMILFLLTTLLNCSPEQETGSLLSPLGWAHLGMEKKELLKRLPLQESKVMNSGLFLSLQDIGEATYKKTGLKDMFFYFRQEDGKKILNAAQMVYYKEAKRIIAIKAALNKLYIKTKNNRYKKGKSIRVDLNEFYPQIFKVTFDTRG